MSPEAVLGQIQLDFEPYPPFEYRTQFYVAGEPKAQPRPRAFSRGGRASVYDPGSAKAWKATIEAAVRPRLPFGGPESAYKVSLIFVLKRPIRLARARNAWIPHTAKPDADNLAKAVLDAMTRAGAWEDDSQVSSLRVMKYYGTAGERTGVMITIHEWKGEWV